VKIAALVLVLAACGGGNSTPPDALVCGPDHCGLQGHTVVKWTFDAYPEWQFPMDSCVDFNVFKVEVDMIAADQSVVTQVEDCGAAQSTFDGLPEGQPYEVHVVPLDFDGNPVVSLPAVGMVNAGAYQADTTVSVNVPWTYWLGSYTGTFLFRLSWAGQGCSAAGVAKQNLTLTVNGMVVTQTADNGQKLDGTDPKPCYDLTQQFPQSATMVPFGPGTLKVDGYSSAMTLIYTKTIDMFVGAGITNPTITYDVPAAI
jgi:hypothetical protein